MTTALRVARGTERDWALSVLQRVHESIRERGIAPGLYGSVWKDLERRGWVKVTAWDRISAIGVYITEEGRRALGN